MRNFLYILSATFFVQTAIAQQMFAPLGAQWHYSSASQGVAPPDAAYWLYESEKDTTINNIDCKKITRKLFNHLGDTITNITPINIITYSSGDTVMYFNNFMNKFTPLYIFNVQQSDTLTFYKPHNPVFGNDTTFRVIVDSVNFFQVNNLNLKRIYTTPLDEFKYIGFYAERIGCYGWLLPEYFTSITENESPLRCYSDAEISINFTSNACNNKTIVGIKDVTKRDALSIYPIPTSDRLHINSFTNKIIHLSIYDVRGVRVKNISLSDMQANINDDVSTLSSGIYFIHIRFQNNTFTVNKFFKE